MVIIMNFLLKVILAQYLKQFIEEENDLQKLSEFLISNSDEMICNWNNKNGHITAGVFVYAEKEKKFLMVYHKDLKMYLYPGGHCTEKDKNPLETAKRELLEETGLKNYKIVSFSAEFIPIDINIHEIPSNLIHNMPSHYHFDFRYLFKVKQIENIILDINELSKYQWLTLDELKTTCDFGKIINKIECLL